jgi:transposase
MTTAHTQSNKSRPRTLHVAFELGEKQWKIACATEAGDNPRLRNLQACDTQQLLREIQLAKSKFKLPPDAPVICCYEAGRDGHWLYRFLTAQKGVTCYEVDSSSIEVNRRQRRAKTDRLDALKLLSQLFRYEGGEKKAWRVVNVPSVEDEARRHLHRELEDWLDLRRQHGNRIKGLLVSMGVTAQVNAAFPQRLEELRMWDGNALPEELKRRLLRDFEGWQFADRKVKDLENQRLREIRTGSDPCLEIVRQLLQLKGIGVGSSWLFVMEVFAWREIKSGRQMGSLAGLTPTPYTSGTSKHEQGISKAGNRRLRAMAVEIGWMWMGYQPESALTKWYQERFAKGSKRLRKIGIVAVARKLLVALWRYIEEGVVPPGAVLVDWKEKVNRHKRKEKPVAMAA